MEFAGEQVDVTFQVNKECAADHDESVAKLGSVSLLGESAVDITPSTHGTPIPEWGYVPQGPRRGVFGHHRQASQGIENITGLLKDVRGAKGTVGKLMTDERLYTELHQFVATANELTEGIRQGRGTRRQAPERSGKADAALRRR